MNESEEPDYSDVRKELDRRLEQAEDKEKFLMDLLKELEEEKC